MPSALDIEYVIEYSLFAKMGQIIIIIIIIKGRRQSSPVTGLGWP
jgi:hypothetical protein